MVTPGRNNNIATNQIDQVKSRNRSDVYRPTGRESAIAPVFCAPTATAGGSSCPSNRANTCMMTMMPSMPMTMPTMISTRLNQRYGGGDFLIPVWY